jgi:hypothetical protein
VRSVPVSSVLMTLLYLTAGGCAGFSQDEAVTPQAATPPPPEGKRLAELVNAAFVTAKLTGAPEVSPVRAAHDSQWGDWMFCIKSSIAEQSPKYAVLIGHDEVLQVRSSVLIDGCDTESYHPLATKDQRGKSDESRGHRH